MVPKVSGVPIVQSSDSSLDRAVPIVPLVPLLRSVQNVTAASSTVQLFDERGGTSTFREFPKRRNDKIIQNGWKRKHLKNV
jgi:hypothetical protein